MEEMLHFEKPPGKKPRVYTYKKAYERYDTPPDVSDFKTAIRLILALSVLILCQAVGCKPISV